MVRKLGLIKVLAVQRHISCPGPVGFPESTQSIVTREGGLGDIITRKKKKDTKEKRLSNLKVELKTSCVLSWRANSKMADFVAVWRQVKFYS